MAENIKNPLSNLSYTNKDFQTIFPEQLDLFKVLTDVYDPSTSNESDPLLILLKEQAILEDKLNYNIDKNSLERFPLSVSQETNARQLYQQLGYNMHWYIAANGSISMKFVGEKKDENETTTYTIPIFTQFTDDDNEIIYTSTQETTISDDNTTQKVNVIQGVPVEYDINGNTTIFIDNLDSNNRLYFDDYNIAENGIFINNIGQTNYQDWKKVDNLSVENLGQTVYEFGVMPNSNTCYIEFPEDIDEYMADGLHITYIKTNGVEGNISANVLTKLANATVVNYSIAGLNEDNQTESLSSENISLTNPSMIDNGKDIENLENAYKNYKKTIGVFKTLVSLRDYADYINTQKLVSNGFVCDRTNDIQNCYYVVTSNGGIDTTKTIIETDANNKPLIGPFDLKLYLLKYVANPSYSVDNYDETFNPYGKIDSYGNPNDIVLSSLKEVKSIQHDFIPYQNDKYLYFKNKYPLNITIVPQYELTLLQQSEVTSNVIQALWLNLNAQQVDFGEEVLYETIYDIIKNADQRIKAIVLNDVIFETYAVYYDGADYQEVKISEEVTPIGVNADTTVDDFQNEIFAKSVLNGNTPLLIEDNTYKYNPIQNSYGSSISPTDEIEEITTDVSIAVGTGGYPLKDNESVTFIAPSFIDEVQYGIYSKYFCNRTISANTDTQLTAGNYIVFFWKSSDYGVYNYHYYKQNTDYTQVVNSSFNITSNTSYSVDDSTTLAFSNNLAVLVSECPAQGILDQSVISHFGDNPVLTNENLEKVIKPSNVLSSDKYVTIKKENKTTLNLKDKEYPAYWITNNVVKDSGKEYYVLFDSSSADQTIILKSGEYFLYSNPEKTSLVILGSGTKITRKVSGGTASQWRVEKTYNTENITAEGLNAFTDEMWFDMWKDNPVCNNVDKIELQEMQFYQFGKGYKVKSTTSQTFTNALETVTGTISYCQIDDSGTEISSYTQLPSLSLLGGNWQGFSSFTFTLSPNVPIELQSGQSITCKIVGSDSPVTLSGQGVKLLSNFDISIYGGSTTDTVSHDWITNTDTYLSLYAYKDIGSLNIANSNISYSYSNTNNLGGQLNITIPQGFPQGFLPSSSINIDGDTGYVFPDGNYLIALEIPDGLEEEISDLHLTKGSSSGDILKEYTTGNSSYTSPGIHYIVFNSQSTNTNHLQLKITTSDDTTQNYVVSIKKIFKFTETQVLDNTTVVSGTTKFGKVKAKIVELDVNNEYDYTHSIDESVEIENPLSAASFMNKNHIYNGYTICQIDNGAIIDNNEKKISPYIYIANRVR